MATFGLSRAYKASINATDDAPPSVEYMLNKGYKFCKMGCGYTENMDTIRDVCNLISVDRPNDYSNVQIYQDAYIPNRIHIFCITTPHFTELISSINATDDAPPSVEYMLNKG
ncbi:MAG: hypothetical protein AAFY41_14215, partial [Bacteroidota bacterium]